MRSILSVPFQRLVCTLAAAIFLLCATASTCSAWDAGGHMIAAQIACNQLPPNTRATADALLPSLIDLREETTARPYDFVTAACWMDDVKPSKKRDGLSSLHYVDAECGQDPAKVEATNALDALKMARVILRSPDADAKMRAEWLAIALHVIGDLHQPLHAIERDRGGNDYPIGAFPGLEPTFRDNGRTTGFARLHQLWDFGYRYDVENGRAKMLFDIGYSNHPDLKIVRETAQKIGAPTTSTQNLNAADWARESNAIACDFAFSTPQREVPSNEYLQHMKALCDARLALAGNRMAAWLIDVLGK